MSVLNRPMFMNRGGQMRHDERTIRNVDDEIYRIAPKTHGSGAGRIDAREEYARDLREKDYLRAQMNRMADGGVAEDGILARLKELDRGLKEDREIEQQARRDRGRKITDYIPFMESDGELWLENILYDGGRGIGSLFESSGEQEEEVRGPALLPETVTFLEETEILNDSTSTEERKAFARMQLEGLKDIPMLDEMLQQVDKIRATRRAAEQDAYHKMLQQVDKKRAAVPEMANGGDVAPMMAPPPMPMDPAMMAPPPMPMAPPPEAQVQMTEDAAAQQGEALGQEYLDEMMTGIDTADSTEELIDAMRGDDRTLQDRYDELANFVGERDASATPESVLTLVQPTIMMTEQGAMDSGIGELMQGIAGEVEMETEMGAPTPMGQGVGELMVSQSIEEVVPEMKRGGPVQYFQDGMEVSIPGSGAVGGKERTAMDLINQAAMLGYQQGMNAPSPDRIQSSMDAYRPLYEQFLGYTDQDRDLAQSQVYFDIASRGLALAGGVNPDTGQPMTGGTLSQIAQAAQTAPRLMAQVGAQQRASERAVDQAALGQAINEETMRKHAEYAAVVRQAGKNVDDRRVVGEDGSNLGTFDLANPREYRAYTTLIAGLDDANKTYEVFKVGVEPVDRFESGIRSTAAEAADKGLSDYTEQAGLARDTIEGLSRTIQGLNAAQEEGGFRPGFASDFRLGLTRLADFLGVEEEFSNTLGRGDQAENLSAATAYLMSQAAGQLGRVTNLSLITLRDSLPSLGKTLGGNILITQALMEANQKDVLLGDVSDYYYKEFGPDSDNPAANFLRPTSTELTPERRDFLENYGVILPPDQETMPSMYAVETQVKNASDSPALQQLSELSIALQEGRELPPQFTVPDNENSLFESILNAGGRVIDQVVGGEDSVLDTTGMDNNQILQATQEFFDNNPTADQMLVRDADGTVFIKRRP